MAVALRSRPVSLLLVLGCLGCGGRSEQSTKPLASPPQTVPEEGTTSQTTTDTETTPGPVGGNRLGAWLWYIDQPGLVVGDHAAMAAHLEGLGVKRVFIKISDIAYDWSSNQITFVDGTPNCGVWQDACEPSNLAEYHARGIETWAWTYNQPYQYEAQADMLEAAIRAGYQGFVLDIEVEFDGVEQPLRDLLAAHTARRDRARTEGWLTGDFPIAATTWGNPADHGMRVDVIDEYVDAHMPQTYVEKWGGIWAEDVRYAIEVGNCEYRDLGAKKPIWHIVSHEDDVLSPERIDAFFESAGPHASLWRIAGPAVSADLEGVDWQREAFTPTDCSDGNFAL